MSDTLSAESLGTSVPSGTETVPGSTSAPSPQDAPLTFAQGFKFPFNRAVGLLNILWIFIPLLGAFAVAGYYMRIVRGFTEGQHQELPRFSFWSDCGYGFVMFFKVIPIMFLSILVTSLLGGLIMTAGLPEWAIAIPNLAVNLLVLPMLLMNFFRNGTVASSFDFSTVKPVFENFGDYIIALLKDICLAIVFILMIVVIVGIPALFFTKNIFIADFYRRRVA
ncbi:MAG TPA: DUF4013 domain-containing protein [bacterium]|nr:DUF4013 domain-containing protein [bacterium]